jgi:hypothetical protein
MSKDTSVKRQARGPTKSAARPARPAWSVPVVVAEVPEAGRRIDLVADAPVRDAIAALAGVVALPRLKASFELMRQGADGLHVVGRVTARVVQTCVVTLEPVVSDIDEPIDLLFTPQAFDGAPTAKAATSLDADDSPEALRDGVVDLGMLATEFLLLGVDPYPRKPGAVFAAPSAGDPGNHPFAALAALKKGDTRQDR